MFERIIRFAIEQRWLVMVAVLALAALGVYNYQRLAIDAVPDITNVQVQINTQASGYSPLETEQRVTYPIETVMAGLPNLEQTRSLSRYGLSQVTVIFRDGTDIYFARQLVNERIQERGGNRALKKRTIMLQIIDEIGDLTTPKGKDESRAQLSAAYIRWGQAQRDHDEVAEAHRALELAQQGNVVRLPSAVPADGNSETAVSEPAQETDEEPWPDYREMV